MAGGLQYQWVHLIIIFPTIMGAAVGAAAGLGARLASIQSLGIALTLPIIGAVFVQGTQHYFDYRRFLVDFEDQLTKKERLSEKDRARKKAGLEQSIAALRKKIATMPAEERNSAQAELEKLLHFQESLKSNMVPTPTARQRVSANCRKWMSAGISQSASPRA